MNKGRIFAFLCVGFCILQSSCRYKIVNHSDRSGKKISLEVRNDSLAQQLGGTLRRALREELLKSSLHRLTDDLQEADLRAVISLSNYSNTPESFSANDSLSAIGFRLNLNATLVLSSGGKTILKENFEVSGSTLGDGSKEPHTRQPNVALARELARRVMFSIVYKSNLDPVIRNP